MSSPGQTTKKDGPPISEAYNPICISAEQAMLFDLAMGERRFEDADGALNRPRGSVVRPEPIGYPGGGSSLSTTDGGSRGFRHGNGPGGRGTQG